MQRTLRELIILRLLKHENVMSLKELLLPQDRKGFDELYLVSELMETDLHDLIKSNQEISPEHTCFFIY